MQSYCLATLLHTHRPQPDLDRALLWLEALSRITGPTADLALRLHLPASTAISRAETRQHHPYSTEQRSYLHHVDAAYSDPAFDAADLTEHISGRIISDTAWESLLPDLGISAGQQPRFRSAQRTCALRWLAVLWKQRTTRPEEFTTQLNRVRDLLRA